MAVLLSVIVSLVCGLDPPGESGPVASQPTNHRAVIRAAFDRINKTPSYFSEMDALKDEITPADLPLLHAELSSGRGPSRRAAAWILAHISSPESVDPLRKALADDQDTVVRWEAAHTLGYIGAKAAEADLIRALQSDAASEVRARAAEALNMLGTSHARAAIRKAADFEQDGSVKGTLKFLLGNPRYREHRRAAFRPGEVTEGYFKGTRYLIYTPRGKLPETNRRWLVTVHGTWNSPEPLVKMAKADADRLHLMVLAPHFDYGQYSWFGVFNLRRGKVRPDLRILEVIDDVSRGDAVDPRLLLFGFSEGGEFVRRFVLAHPDRVERAAATGAGLVLRPDPTTPFPTGTAANRLAPDLGELDFGQLVQTPLAMVLGTKDERVPQSKLEEFMEAVRRHAKEKGIASPLSAFVALQPRGGPASCWRGCSGANHRDPIAMRWATRPCDGMRKRRASLAGWNFSRFRKPGTVSRRLGPPRASSCFPQARPPTDASERERKEEHSAFLKNQNVPFQSRTRPSERVRPRRVSTRRPPCRHPDGVRSHQQDPPGSGGWASLTKTWPVAREFLFPANEHAERRE